MADLTKISVNGTSYDVKDTTKIDLPSVSVPQNYVPKSNGDGTVTWGSAGGGGGSTAIDYSQGYDASTGNSAEFDTGNKWYNGKTIFKRFCKIPKELITSGWVEIPNQYLNANIIEDIISVTGGYGAMIINSGSPTITSYLMAIAMFSDTGFLISKGTDVGTPHTDVVAIFEYTKKATN